MYFFELLEGEFLDTETKEDLPAQTPEDSVGGTTIVDLSNDLTNPTFGTSILGFHNDLLGVVGSGISPGSVEIQYANSIVRS